MLRAIEIIWFLVVMVFVVLLLFFSRHRFAFKNIFGVPPKQAIQEMVDKKIRELQETFFRREDGLSRFPTEEDRDWAGMAQNGLERAKKLAKKYGFSVPE